MKMPNGWGSITKQPGNRRKPWRVQKTDGWEWVSLTEKEWIDPKTKKIIKNPTEEQILLKQVKQRPKVIKNPTAEQIVSKAVKQRRIYLELGSYATRQEAVTALADYNKNPFDIQSASITFEEVYDKWSDIHFEKIKDTNGYKSAFKTCKDLYRMRIADITLNQLQKVVDESGKNTPTLKTIKNMWGLMWDYCVIHEILPKEKREMIRYVDISKAGNPNAYNRKPFSKREIDAIWKWKDANDFFQVILMLIYTGVRISELLDLKKTNVNLAEKWFDVVASKTESGVRKVPINEKVLPFFEHWFYKNDSDFLISTPDGKHFSYHNYYDSYWTPLMNQMNMLHRPHDTRHTCISLLADAGVDERMVKKIVGHKGQGVTQTVYTHFEIEALLKAINMI